MYRDTNAAGNPGVDVDKIPGVGTTVPPVADDDPEPIGIKDAGTLSQAEKLPFQA